MKLNLILFFLSFVFFTSAVHAHTFTGMVGFYDGLSHPVLGIDHFLAMAVSYTHLTLPTIYSV